MSWNVNGFAARMRDGTFMRWAQQEQPDIVCLQEIKIERQKAETQWGSQLECLFPHRLFHSCQTHAGRHGTAIFSKEAPLAFHTGMAWAVEDLPEAEGVVRDDVEGRVVTAEFERGFVVCPYVPNSGRGQPRLKLRTQQWDPSFMEFLEALRRRKPLFVCGDLNVAAEAIDLKNPKTNTKTSGFLLEERQRFRELKQRGFRDMWRSHNPDRVGCYTFWSSMGNARGKNVGWRLDYTLVDDAAAAVVTETFIRRLVKGSDHCPIGIVATSL